ncbi:MAG: ATP-binding protein [Melioribacteraceae bacterium]|nr:ATP-binding protein [Melioribacteraceae bacterium]MCF8354013.1 ATP-binding protein [Melioribacteraceae bacterium]MCF8392306.1 ATP-binding protein [Melioribacteraceae bacterium]MCF8417638.1 ATP-binding protein [Melioribacteraceae bacterium]
MNSFAFQLKNDLDELNKLAAKLEEIGEKLSLPQKVQFDVNLSLDELITNIISYSFKDEKEHLIDFVVELEDNKLIITVTDDGNEFDPFAKPDPNLDTSVEEKHIGGLGIFFIKQKMTEYSYKRNNKKNIVTLVKKID